MSKFNTELKVVDVLTGEVIENKKSTFRFQKSEEPTFVKLFVEDVARLTSLSKPAMSLLLHSMKKMSYLNEIYYTADDKQYYSKVTEMSIKHVEKCIMELKKKELIFPRGCAKFVINPYYFGKGDWNNVSGIRMTIVYDENGKMIDVVKAKTQNK